MKTFLQVVLVSALCCAINVDLFAQCTVPDTIPPAANCNNISVYLDGTGTVSINVADINRRSNKIN